MNKTKSILILISIISISLFTIYTVNAQELLQDNHDPVIESFEYSPHLIEIMSSVDAIVNYSDSDLDDTHIIIIDWGDGKTDSGTMTSLSHIYEDPGIYRLTVTVEDNNGGRATMVHPSKIIVYDSLAGFTSGGGWIICPHDVTGAPTLGYFGFVAKYHEGEAKGNVVFHIKDGLRFKSTSIYWLVITGDNRVIYGLGLINGETECLFTVKVRDSGKDDGFDIILVEQDTYEIIYDSYESDYSTYYTVLPLNGGNIATHEIPNQVKAETNTESSEKSQTTNTQPPKENNGNAYGKYKNNNLEKSKKHNPKDKS